MPLEPSSQDSSSPYQGILGLVRELSGHDFSGYKDSMLNRQIEQRMMVSQIGSPEDYEELLGHQPHELGRLCRELLIGVTSFFRDRAPFESLSDLVFSKLVEENCSADDSVRVWVVGCSTGEEVYSLAILAQEQITALSCPAKLNFFATDINPEALGRARLGVYSSRISQSVSRARLDRFFVPHEGGFRVLESLRELIVFADHSLIRDIPFSHIDLVSCRNLLMYLKPETQKKALQRIHYALKPDGFLFLGQSESVGAHENLFAQVDSQSNIYQRIGHSHPSEAIDAAKSLLLEASSSFSRSPSLAEISEGIAENEVESWFKKSIGSWEETRFGNEEFRTANEELKKRCMSLKEQLDESVVANDELKSLFDSLDTAMIFFDMDLEVVRYTQPACQDFSLTPSDIGLSVAELKLGLQMKQTELLSLVKAVLRDLRFRQQEVKHRDESSSLMTIKPFRRSDNSIGGVVLVFEGTKV